MRNRIFIYLISAILCLDIVGCAGLQRKFIRKKKVEERPAPIITTYDYAKDLRVDELYKKHFLFWRTWQDELILRIDESYKKRIDCYDNLVMHLDEMAGYLKEEKSTELRPYIEEIKSLDNVIRKKNLSESETYRLRHIFEITRRQIDKKFSYSKVKDCLELKK